MTAELINSSKGRSIKISNIVHESPTLFKVCEGGGRVPNRFFEKLKVKLYSNGGTIWQNELRP